MSTNRYKKMTKAGVVVETGYTKAWGTPVADFTTLQVPALSSPAVIGEKFKIDDDHVWASGKKAIPFLVRTRDLEGMGDSVGETESLSTKYKIKAFFIGDSAEQEEIITNLMNEDLIIHIQQGCDTDATYIQLGCACSPAICEKRSFTSGTKESGKKGSELEFATTSKFFYNGAIDARTS